MKHNTRPVWFTGQHFTIDHILIAHMIRIASLDPNDTVLDIGAGKGAFTLPLAQHCKRVIAIENDPTLLEVLRTKCTTYANIAIVGTDFQQYTLPRKKYKVVSNIPYRITSKILKSLLYTNMECFEGGVLIMQLQPAQQLVSARLCNPYKIFYNTFFTLTLLREIAPESFQPSPSVRSALVQIRKKDRSLPAGGKIKYLSFLSFLLQNHDTPARTALKTLFRKSQVRDLAQEYNISLNNPVVSLSPHQWWGCFLALLDKVPEKFHPKGRR